MNFLEFFFLMKPLFEHVNEEPEFQEKREEQSLSGF